MAKITQQEVKELADRIIAIDEAIAASESKRGAELDPFLRKLEADTHAINAKFDAKVDKLRSERDSLMGDVTAWLTQHGKPIVITGERAAAANELVVGRRTVDAKTFFDAVPVRTPAFWSCLSVGIAKAEKLIGQTAVDEIANKETKLVPSVRALRK